MFARIAGLSVVPSRVGRLPGDSGGSLRSGSRGGVAAADVGRPGQTDEQGVAAHGTSPFPAVAVRYIRAARSLRMNLLEHPLLTASGAVPAQLRHPGDLLGAVCRGLAGVDADSGTQPR